MDSKELKKYMAELVGTFVLVLIGCGAAVFDLAGAGILGVAIAFGVAVLVMVYTIGPISGCHINPAITIAMRVLDKISNKDMGFYILFQCVGALLAAAVLFGIASGLDGYTLADGLGQNGYGDHSPAGYNLAACFFAEVILTVVFLVVILGATHKNAVKGFAGIAIGLTLMLIHIVAIPITGTSVNPARSLGPALVYSAESTDALEELWLFILAPIIGACLGALLWKYVLEPEDDEA